MLVHDSEEARFKNALLVVLDVRGATARASNVHGVIVFPVLMGGLEQIHGGFVRNINLLVRHGHFPLAASLRPLADSLAI